MGVFDFFSKGNTSSKPQPVSSIQPIPNNQAQDDSQSGAAVNPTQFSDVKYPLPSVPSNYDASNVVAQDLSLPPIPASPMGDTSMNPMDGSEPQTQPQTMPEPPDITNFDFTNGAAPQPTTNIQPQDLPSLPPIEPTPVEAPIPAAPVEQPAAEVPPTPEKDSIMDQIAALDNINTMNNLNDTPATTSAEPQAMDVMNALNNVSEQTVDTTTTEITPADNTVTQNTVNAEEPKAPGQQETQPPIDSGESMLQTGIENLPTNNTAEVTEPAPTSEMPAPETVQEPVPENPTEEKQPAPTVELTELQQEISEVLPSEEVKVEKQEENQPQDTSSNIVEQMPDDIKFQIFKRIGFLGLNSDSKSSEVKELVNSIYKAIDEIIIDSSKGSGEDIISIADKNNIKLTGIYLKPFYANYDDEAENEPMNPNYTAIVYSSISEKIQQIIKSADIFIIPETKGLVNMSELFTVWNIQTLYLEQHKPIILLGEEWKTKLDNLKNFMKITDNELSVINIAANAKEAVSLIVKLDHEYSTKKPTSMKRVIDKREESDEDGYFLK